MAYYFLKRFFDVAVAGLGLLFISPFLLVVILLLRFTGEGQIFYRQERVGRQGKIFFMLKFATMLKDSPNMTGGAVTVSNDPRITPVGKVLRKTKVNELPQLLNVLRADMSLVGPRPLVPASFAKYAEPVRELISCVQPGVTGIGSLIFRDEEELITEVARLGAEPLDYYRDWIYPYKGELETWYVKKQSILVDVLILIMTLVKVVAPKSEMVYKCFADLPKKPKELTVSGIRTLYLEKHN